MGGLWWNLALTLEMTGSSESLSQSLRKSRVIMLFSIFVLATISVVDWPYKNEHYSNFVQESCQESASR
jgi:hypothetical protein